MFFLWRHILQKMSYLYFTPLLIIQLIVTIGGVEF